MSPFELPPRLSVEALRCANEILDTVVPHTEFANSLQGALKIVQWMQEFRMPGGVLLLADAGMGKTLFLQVLKRTLSAQAPPLKTTRPVLEISLDSAADVHQVAAKLLLALGYEMLPMRPTLLNMTDLVDKAIERLRPTVMFIDEGQHVCEGNRQNIARTLTDWLKVRMDKHNLPVIMVGTPTLEGISEINPQFVSRVSLRYFLNAFAFDDEWRGVLGSIAQTVTTLDLEGLSTTGLSRLTHEATRGNLRRLKKLLVFSCVRAIGCGAQALKLEHLAEGYVEAFGGAPDGPNPFQTAIERARRRTPQSC
ncbi:TniB family NTP-binding protein [Hydrogenophaga borbori]